MSQTIQVETVVKQEIRTVWDAFTQPAHIVNWNFASEDWHCPAAQSDFVPGGKFTYTMAAKDGSFSFDFLGTFLEIKEREFFTYQIADGRHVEVRFAEIDGGTQIVENFEPESMNPPEMQQAGWQSILNQFKAYVESK